MSSATTTTDSAELLGLYERMAVIRRTEQAVENWALLDDRSKRSPSCEIADRWLG